MSNLRFFKRLMTQKRPERQSGGPGGMLWLLTWLVVLALVVLLILAILPSDSTLAA